MRVLIIRLGALGDVAIATPFIEKILESYPESEVWLLTAPPYRELFINHPQLKVQTFPRKGLKAMCAALAWVNARKFDAVYDLQGTLRSRLLAIASRARLCAGLNRGFPYTHTPPPRGDARPDNHIFARFNAILQCAGLPAAEPRVMLVTDAAEREHVQRWLREKSLSGRPLVLMHTGSSARWVSRRWEERHFAELARALHERGLHVIWVGGPEERELNARLAAHGGVNAAEAFSVLELVELARQARFAVTNDSGPMHIIAAAEIPIYALFGPTDWRRSHALGQGGRVLTHSVPCSPCYLPVCPPQREHRCLRDLTPQAVLQRLITDGMLSNQ
ncbi:MAG: glycosyltransferase family 9 protein [Gammaproteobacteria bacterium]|nr:MAG: glycosyltransferase family 9 protein [Gammaproteobacteria bacterium]